MRKKNWKEASKEERLTELKRLFTTPEDKLRPKEFKTFNDLHKRIDELVGRPTMTHEFAFPELLYEEISLGKRGNPLGESLIKATKLTKGKKALIVTPTRTGMAELDTTKKGTPLGFTIVAKLDLSKKKSKK